MFMRISRCSALLAALPAIGFSQDTLFPVSHGYAAVDAPWNGALADLNGDLNLDFAVPNYHSNKVSIYRGSGTGTLVPQPPLTVGGQPRALVLADLNGDGALDVATANSTSDSVSVLLGNGGGGFGPPALFPTGSFPVAIDAGDLDGDGDLDIVTGDQADATLSVLLGNGSGALSAPVPQALGFAPERIHLADLNGDGNLDCVAACWLDDQVTVSRGNGTGSLVFGPSAYTPSPKGLAIGDVTGDGRPDVVTVSSQYDMVYVFRANANGSLAAPKPHWLGTTGVYPTSVDLADANGDGRLDLFVCSAGVPSISLLIGAGGSDYFDFAHTSPIQGGVPFDASVGDLDGDGFADVVTSYLGADAIRAHVSAGVGAWESYCTAKVNSLGCTPNLYATGTPSASNPRPYWVIATNVLDHKSGMFIYKVNGARAALPFHGGTLCVGPSGIRRTPVQDSAGDPKVSPPNCTGAYGMNFNAFAAGLAGGNPDPALLVVGSTYQLQVWSRDPGFAPPNDVGLSRGFDVTVWL